MYQFHKDALFSWKPNYCETVHIQFSCNTKARERHKLAGLSISFSDCLNPVFFQFYEVGTNQKIRKKGLKKMRLLCQRKRKNSFNIRGTPKETLFAPMGN